MKIELEAKLDRLSTPSSFWFFITALLLLLITFSGCNPASPPSSLDFSCADVTEIPRGECEALVKLYESTYGTASRWDGWLESKNPCSWHGILCNNGHVVELDLCCLSMIGEIPKELGNLSKLRKLDFGRNNLSGEIPPELGNLHDLKIFLMDENQLSGEIPKELFNCVNLILFSLYDNQITGEIPHEIGYLSQLVELNLKQNQLTGSIPEEIGYLTHLMELALENNALSGEVPDTTINLPGFQSLCGNRRCITFGYNMLKSSDIRVREYLLDHYEDWFKTQTISPDDLQVIETFNTSSVLSWTAIPYTEDEGGYQIGLATSSNLRYTPYNNTTEDKTTNTITVHDLQPGTKYYIAIRTHTAPHGEQQNDLWSPYSEPVQVNTFSCANVDQIPRSECEALVALFESTEGMNWTDRDGWLNTTRPCDWFGVNCDGTPKAQHVYALILNNNNLEGQLPGEFVNLLYLKEIQLSENHLTGRIPDDLSAFSQLKYIDISENRFFGEIPDALSMLPLIYLHLENNAFRGDIPRSFINLRESTNLDLSYNMLSASDPTLVMTLFELQPDWESTQTVSPTDFRVGQVTSSGVYLEWSPIEYTAHGGGYEIGYATSESGPFTMIGSTADKSVDQYTATGLSIGERYFLAIRTHTPQHDIQQNDLVSPWVSTADPCEITFRCQEVAEIPRAECEVLQALFEDTNGENWINNNSWLHTLTPCSWDGVTCRNRHVKIINLTENNMFGTLPSEIDALAELEYLYLSHNDLCGVIPYGIFNLNELRSLYLDHNHFEGAIFTKIDSLINLNELDLSSNRLVGTIPEGIGGLSLLRVLRLDNNALEGIIPETVSRLANLDSNQTDYGYNMLINNDWIETQTIPPAGFTVSLSDSYIQFFWIPIPYQNDQGGYELSYSRNEYGANSVVFSESADKTSGRHEIEQELLGSGNYYFWIRTHTDPHDEQENDLWSAYAGPVGPITIP